MTAKLKNALWISGVLAAIILVGSVIYNQLGNTQTLVRQLPYYDVTPSDGKPHYVKPFQFTDQQDHAVSEQTVNGKIYVAEFFFCNCQGICPVMNKQMMRIAARYKSENDFMILSHTVKPREDTVTALFQYANAHHANYAQWRFLTGNENEIFDMARNAYMVAEPQYALGDDFVHTEYFSLVDKNKQVRGLYDGTDSLAIDSLMNDIDLLLQQQRLSH